MTSNELRLGKFGNVQQLAQGGVRKEDIDQKFKNIFDAFDADKNNVLTKDEISSMKQQISSYANHGKNSIFSNKEAEKMIENNAVLKQNNETAENLFQFLQNIESKVKNGNVTESRVDKDGNAVVSVAEGNKDVTKTYDKKDGKSVLETVTVEKDEQGNPKTKTVIKEGSTETYTYINGKEYLTKKVENAGTDDEKVTEIKYDEQGQETSETVTSKTSEETKEIVNGELKTTHKIDNKNDSTKRKETTVKYTENGRTETVNDYTGTTTIEYIGSNKVKTTKNGQTTEVTTNEDGGKTEVVTNDKNTTTNVLNKDNHRLSQKKVVNGKEYNLSYDGQGNTTGIIVQNGESLSDIAHKFGVTEEQLIEANKDILGDKKYFDVGTEIKIPRELDANAPELKGRKSAEEAKADFAHDQEVRRQRAVASREERASATYTSKPKGSYVNDTIKQMEVTYLQRGCKKMHYKSYEEYTTKLLQNEVKNGSLDASVLKNSKLHAALVAKIKQLNKNANIATLDTIKVPVTRSYYNKLHGITHNQQLKKDAGKRSRSANLAQQFYNIADDYAGLTSVNKMQEFLNRHIGSGNICEFLDAYDNNIKKGDDTSILDTICSETGAGLSTRYNACNTIMQKLSYAATKLGVSNGDIQKAKKEFVAGWNKESKKLIGNINTKDMEKAMNFLRGCIRAKQVGGNMSTKDAIAELNSTASDRTKTANKSYNDAKGEDWSFSAKAGDWICRLFGCNTIGEMEEKLGSSAKTVKELANCKTEKEFTTKYRHIFGIDFDPKKIAAYSKAQTNFQVAAVLDTSVKDYNNILNYAKKADLSKLEFRLSRGFDSPFKNAPEQFDAVKKEIYKGCTTDEQKKQALVTYLTKCRNQTNTSLKRFLKENGCDSLQAMGSKMELITQSAFGTKDIGKDVAQFTQNMAKTEMITDMAGDILLTVALAAIPGGGEWAAGRLAIKAAQWGTKGAKIVKVLNRVKKGFSIAKNLEHGTLFKAKVPKTVAQTVKNAGKVKPVHLYVKSAKVAKAANVSSKIVSGTLNAAGGTAAYETMATNHTKEEIIQKCISNGLYGAIGGGASELAPKLMQIFKIDSQFATEIAENVINAVGSAGVTKLQGGEYGKQDAAFDIIAGMLMGRLSHGKNTKEHSSDILYRNTHDGTSTSGGKFGDKKYQTAKAQVADVAQHGTAEEIVHTHQEADLHQAKSRTQGHGFKHILEDGSGFVTINGKRIDFATATKEQLEEVENVVKGWTDGTRNKEAILANIEKNKSRLSKLRLTQAKSTTVVNGINQNVSISAENILKGKQGAIGSHDAATLSDHIKNNLNTVEDLDNFIASLKKRVGVYNDGSMKGKMFVYEVQGRDFAAELLHQAETKKAALTAQKAGLNDAMSGIDNAIKNDRGLTNEEFSKVKAYAQKTNSADELQTLIDKMSNNKNIKKSSAAKKLIADMKTKRDQLKTDSKPVHKEDPATQKPADGPVVDNKKDEPVVDEKKNNPVNDKKDEPVVNEKEKEEINKETKEISYSMPPALKSEWKKCETKIKSFFNNLSTEKLPSLIAEGKALLENLSNIKKYLSSAAKAKLESIEQKVKDKLNTLRKSSDEKINNETPSQTKGKIIISGGDDIEIELHQGDKSNAEPKKADDKQVKNDDAPIDDGSTRKTEQGKIAQESEVKSDKKRTKWSGKFGTPENPKYENILFAETESDLRECLAIMDNLPDFNYNKSKIKAELQAIEYNKARFSAKIDNAKNVEDLGVLSAEIRSEVNNSELLNELLAEIEIKRRQVWKFTPDDGFKRVKDAKTTIRTLSIDDIYVGARTQSGAMYEDLAWGKHFDIDGKNANPNYCFKTYLLDNNKIHLGTTDRARQFISAPKVASIYNGDLDVTGIQIEESSGRGTNYQFYIKGQVSESDVQELGKELKTKRLDENDPNSPLLIQNNPEELTKTGEYNRWCQRVGTRLQEEIAAFFNKRA